MTRQGQIAAEAVERAETFCKTANNAEKRQHAIGEVIRRLKCAPLEAVPLVDAAYRDVLQRPK